MKRSIGGTVACMALTTWVGSTFVQRLGAAQPVPVASVPSVDLRTPHAKTETAVFAGGCFWGIQAVFQHVKGVVSATSGYTGGKTDKPTYEEVSSGTTGYAESVRVVYDPAQVAYGTLLRVFFSVAHDPTQLNRQGPDVGTQYRSEIFYTSDEQKDMAEAYIAQLRMSHLYAKPIVTQLSVLKGFHPAEAYHQNYAELHPEQPYIAINDAPKVANLKKAFPELFSEKLAAHE
jgi:peptide-methionine (S)-S-oxide reductase